jgi:hypothetical protein
MSEKTSRQGVRPPLAGLQPGRHLGGQHGGQSAAAAARPQSAPGMRRSGNHPRQSR